jgi:hypothetical protein
MLPWLSDKVLPYEWAAAVFSTREWRFEEKISSSYFLYIQIIFHVNLEFSFRVYIMYSVLFQHQKKKKTQYMITWWVKKYKNNSEFISKIFRLIYYYKIRWEMCEILLRHGWPSLLRIAAGLSIHMCFIIVVALFSTWTNYTKRKNKCSFRWNLFLLKCEL